MMSSVSGISSAVQAGVQPSIGPCRWCGNHHGVFCPSVKAIEFYQDGATIKRVEFHAPVSTTLAIALDSPSIASQRAS